MRPLVVDIHVCVAICLALATLLVGCRFWARYITNVKLWWDDYFAGAAYLVAVIWSVVIISWTFVGGLGQEIHTLDISAAEAIKRSKIYVILAELCYAFSLAFSKYAILGMYWRLFSTSTIRIPIQVLLAMSTIWLIIRTFMTIFHCTPPQAFWDDTIKDKQCNINNSKFFFGTTLTHLLLDVAILVLPVMQVRKLKLKTGQKVGVIGLFMFGIIVCIASIVLLVAATSLDNESTEMPYDMTTIMIPANIEIMFAIVSACLPMMRPIVQRLLPSSGLDSTDPASHRGHSRIGTRGTRTGASVKLRTLTTAIELDDDSSTKNFADRNYTTSCNNFADVEVGSSESHSDDHSRPGHKTVIQAERNDRDTSSMTELGGGIRVKNETSISYE